MIKAEIGGFFTFSRKWKLALSLFLLIASISIISDVFKSYTQSGLDGWDYYMILLGAGNFLLSLSGILSYFKPPYLATNNNKVHYKPTAFHKTIISDFSAVKIIHDSKLSFTLQINDKSYQLSYSLFDFKNMQNINKIKELIFESNSVDIADIEIETV